MEKLKDRLIAELERKGWKGTELAREAKVSQSFVGALVAGNQEYSKHVPAIAHALGVDAYWLTTGKGDRRGIRFEAFYDKYVAAVLELMLELDHDDRVTVKAKVEEWAKEQRMVADTKLRKEG